MISCPLRRRFGGLFLRALIKGILTCMAKKQFAEMASIVDECIL